MIKISAMRSIPPMVEGYVRDVSLRWALAEVGLEYEVQLVDADDRKTGSYRQRQPFGQVPWYEEDGLVLFESGAIVLHIAEKSHHLLPKDAAARARTKSWMFAATSTIDPVIKNFEEVEYFGNDAEWARLRRPDALAAVKERLDQLAQALGTREYLENVFTGADLLMVMALRNLGPAEVLHAIPSLVQYVQRCEARTGFQTALAKHKAIYAK